MSAPTEQPPREPRKVRKLHEPPPPDKRTINDFFLADLRKSGLSDETIRAAGLYTEDRPLALSDICGRPYPRTCGPALVFPFHLPGREAYAFRIKPTNPRLGKPNRAGKRKPIKYDQISERGSFVYLPPWARESGALSDPAAPILYFTEGEKKALAFDQLRLPCVGLCGVDCYAATGDDAPGNDAPERLHKTIREHVAIAGKHVVICYDADAKDKPPVMHAAGRFAGVLLAAGAVSVKLVIPPSLEHKGIDDFLGAHGQDAMRALLATAQDIEPLSPREPALRLKTIKCMAQAPIDNDMRLPAGYTIERDGVLWKTAQDERHSDAAIAPRPILVQRYLNDYYTSEERVEIAFPRESLAMEHGRVTGQFRWVSVCVDRKSIVDTRAMVANLSVYGAPVTSNSAARVVDWIEEFERVNTGKVQRIACVSRAGWHTIDGVTAFVTDIPLFADPDEAPELVIDPRGDRRRMFAALKPRDSLRAHTEALAQAWASDPIAAAVLAACLAAPLLLPLACPNFAMHLPGDSSRGKTTLLKMGASVYGDPNNDQWVASWNTTAVGAEMRAAVLCDLPLCFDEIGAGDKVQIEKLVYMLVNGGGRTRSQRDLTVRETPSWRTIVLSTGERGLAEESAATGAQVRVIQLPISGIGTLDGAQVDALRQACVSNAGAFGRAWLQELLAIQDWVPYRESLAQYRAILRTKSVSNLQQRTSEYWALLCQAESMAAQLGVGLHSGATILQLFDRLSKSGDQLRPASERARQHVEEWISIEPRAFPHLLRGPTGEDDAPQSSNSSVVHGYLRHDGAILFWPNELRTYLEASKYAYEQVCRDWLKRDWLEISADGRTQKLVKIEGRPRRMVVLLPVVAEAVT